MKKILLLLTVLAIAVSLCACGGNVSNVETHIGESSIYTRTDINSAMNKVLLYFSREFNGCTLTDLWYDEELSLLEAEEWSERYDAEQAIILRSNFHVDASGGDGSLNPNSTYTDWKWILVRSSGSWKLMDWGY